METAFPRVPLEMTSKSLGFGVDGIYELRLTTPAIWCSERGSDATQQPIHAERDEQSALVRADCAACSNGSCCHDGHIGRRRVLFDVDRLQSFFGANDIVDFFLFFFLSKFIFVSNYTLRVTFKQDKTVRLLRRTFCRL